MSNESNTPKIALFTALIAAQKAASAVEKGSKNTFHKYAYASAESIICEAREALSECGLAVITTDWLVRDERMHVVYLLVHGSGESMEFRTSTAVIPDKGRPLDKAEATALTYNLGYFLRGLLLLPRVEQGTQADERDDRNYDHSEKVRQDHAKKMLQEMRDREPRALPTVDEMGSSQDPQSIAYVPMQKDDPRIKYTELLVKLLPEDRKIVEEGMKKKSFTPASYEAAIKYMSDILENKDTQ